MEAATVARLGLSLENVDDHMMFVVLAVKLVLALFKHGTNVFPMYRQKNVPQSDPSSYTNASAGLSLNVR